MFELMLSIPAALLRFKGLKAVSNSSVVKSEQTMASLKESNIPCNLLRLVEYFPQGKDLHL